MPRWSPESVKAKIAFVKETVAAGKSLLMNAVAKKVREKFNESLAPDKLRAAFLEAGGTIGKPGRPKNPYGKAATAQPAEPKPERRKARRRRADKSATKAVAALQNLDKHIVVIRNGDTPEVHEFKTPDKAKSFLTDKLAKGIPACALGYYSRQALEVTVGI